MRTLYVDGEILVDRCTKLMDGHVKYSLGAKVSVDANPSTITKVDCSGFTRYIFYQACMTKVSGGSWMQNDWLRAQGFATVTYDDVAPNRDNMLRVGYFSKPADLAAGHIWFILNGKTIESYGGSTKHGPGRRPWDTPVLRSRVSVCYEIGALKKYEETSGPFGGMCKVVNLDVSDSFE